MPVPKAAMHKYDRAIVGQNDVWTAGKIALVQGVSQAAGMEIPPDSEFGLSVSTLDSRHHPRAGLWVNDVH
jgi:hypothetical protein